MALPALRALSPSQYQAFRGNLRALVAADQKIDLFEWTLQRILLAHLRPHFERVRPPRVRYSSLRRLTPQCGVVLSILAHAGGRSDAQIRAAFEQGASHLHGVELALLPLDRCGLADLDPALQRLAEANPSSMQQLLEGLRRVHRRGPRGDAGRGRIAARNRRRPRLPDAASPAGTTAGLIPMARRPALQRFLEEANILRKALADTPL